MKIFFTLSLCVLLLSSKATNNRLVIGDGSNTDKIIEANTPSVNKPFIAFQGGQWVVSDDGVSTSPIGGAGAPPSTIESGLTGGNCTIGNICSGAYIPTGQIVSNVTSVTPLKSRYAILGDIILVSYRASVDPGTGNFIYRLSLPYNLNRAGSAQCYGVKSSPTQPINFEVFVDNSGEWAQFQGHSTNGLVTTFQGIVICTSTNTL